MAKDCLMVMNARDIPECTLSIRALQIDKVWFRGFTERELEPQIEGFVSDTDYDRYILVSDDVIATQFALDNLLKVEEAGPVVTGWCNIFPATTLSSVELNPILTDRASLYMRVRDRLPKSWVPHVKKLYHVPLVKKIAEAPLYAHFPDLDEVWSQEPVFRTYFVNWALTSMTREMWLKYGFHYSESLYAGHGSDQHISLALAKDDVLMLCARDSFVYHLASVRHFIVGKVPKEVIFEPWPPFPNVRSVPLIEDRKYESVKV